jgi:hypothetical protein
LSRLRGLTASNVITHSAHPAGPQPGVSAHQNAYPRGLAGR